MNADARPLILHVIHHLHVGGMENGVVNLINHLPADRYRHAVACIEDYSDFRHRIARTDVEVIALHRSTIGTWRLRHALYQLCRRLRPSLVHSRNQSGLDALAPARLAGVPTCIHGEHGWDVDNLAGKRWKPALLRRLHSPLVGRYVVVSEDLRQFLVERIGIDPARIVRIYNGVDTGRFQPGAKAYAHRVPGEYRESGRVLIGCIGRLQPVKDHATLLRGFSRLVCSRPGMRERVRLAIIGDGPLLPELQSLAGSLGIANVTWFSGALDKIEEILPAFDVFTLPSLNEGISNTVLEAMACGIPVVATAVGGTTELVKDNVCGRLFRPCDDAALAQLLDDYVMDGMRREADGMRARQMAVDRFSLSRMLASYGTLYDLCTDRGGRATTAVRQPG